MNISRATLGDDKPRIPAHLVTSVCQVGQGAQTCSYLCHQGGWACAKGSNFQKVIDAKRVSPEGMKAMGNNCSGPPDFIPTITTITE